MEYNNTLKFVEVFTISGRSHLVQMKAFVTSLQKLEKKPASEVLTSKVNIRREIDKIFMKKGIISLFLSL